MFLNISKLQWTRLLLPNALWWNAYLSLLSDKDLAPVPHGQFPQSWIQSKQRTTVTFSYRAKYSTVMINLLLLHSPSTLVSSSHGSILTWRSTNQRTDMPTWLPTTILESCSPLLMVCRPPTSSLPTAVLIPKTACATVSFRPRECNQSVLLIHIPPQVCQSTYFFSCRRCLRRNRWL